MPGKNRLFSKSSEFLRGGRLHGNDLLTSCLRQFFIGEKPKLKVRDVIVRNWAAMQINAQFLPQLDRKRFEHSISHPQNAVAVRARSYFTGKRPFLSDDFFIAVINRWVARDFPSRVR